jgi:hypothetical protein
MTSREVRTIETLKLIDDRLQVNAAFETVMDPCSQKKVQQGIRVDRFRAATPVGRFSYP